MRPRLTLVLVLALTGPSLHAQEAAGNPPAGAQRPGERAASTDSVLPSEFTSRFPSFSFLRNGFSQDDFAALRAFQTEKESEQRVLRARREQFMGQLQDIELDPERPGPLLRRLRAAIPPNSDTTLYLIESLPSHFDDILGGTTPGIVTVAGARRLETHLAGLEVGYERREAAIHRELRLTDLSLAALGEDLMRTEDAIAAALQPERREMWFRGAITFFFAVLIGLMIWRFFTLIGRQPGARVAEQLLGENGLQFVTIFVLIIAIILFGIMEILQGSELAAILSGISGYILGRGAQMKASADRAGAVPPAAPPAPQAQAGPGPAAIPIHDVRLPGVQPAVDPVAPEEQSEPVTSDPAGAAGMVLVGALPAGEGPTPEEDAQG